MLFDSQNYFVAHVSTGTYGTMWLEWLERCVQHELLLIDHEEHLQFLILVHQCGWQDVDLKEQVITVVETPCDHLQLGIDNYGSKVESHGWSWD